MHLGTHRKSDILLLCLVLLAGVWAWALLYPALNWPDEVYKVDRIGVDTNPYLKIVSYLVPDYCYITYTADSSVGYLSNTFHLKLIDGFSCYTSLKVANTFLASLIAGLCLLVLQSPEKKKLFLLSLIWPANLFLMTGINQQVVFSIVSTAIVVSVIEARRIWPYLFLSGVLLTVDRSFISLIAFLGFLMIARVRPRRSVTTFVILIILSSFAKPYVGSLAFVFGGAETLAEHSARLADYRDSPLESLGLFFISLVYLGGTNSVLGFGPEYVVIFFLLLTQIFKKIRSKPLQLYMGSFLMTYFAVISFIPTIQSYRYYVFIAPAILYFVINAPKLRSYYIGYSILMSAAYLMQSSFKDG